MQRNCEIKIMLSQQEYIALRELSKEKDLTYQQILIQALRTYQFVNTKPDKFERLFDTGLPKLLKG
jgi:hypothetical protein